MTMGGIFIALIFAPVVACSIRSRRESTKKHWAMPVIISVLFSWLLQIFYRIRVGLPLNIQRAQVRG